MFIRFLIRQLPDELSGETSYVVHVFNNLILFYSPLHCGIAETRRIFSADFPEKSIQGVAFPASCRPGSRRRRPPTEFRLHNPPPNDN